MSVTRNGFAVQKPTSTELVTFKLEGVPFKVWTPSQKAFAHLAGYLNAVEPVTEAGWDGGYAYRPVSGTSVWSEHSAGTAIDWNASQHLRTGKPSQGWDATQVRMIRWYLAHGVGKLFRWGADFSNPDPMHFELRSKALWDSTHGWWKQ